MTDRELLKYYETLELEPGASAEEIHNAYIHLKSLYSRPSMATIPIDDEWDDSDKSEILEQLEMAYRRLSEPEAPHTGETALENASPTPPLAPETEKPTEEMFQPAPETPAPQSFPVDDFASDHSEWHQHEIILPGLENEPAPEHEFADGGGLGLLDETFHEPDGLSGDSGVEPAEMVLTEIEPEVSAGATLPPDVFSAAAAGEETGMPAPEEDFRQAAEEYDGGSGSVVSIQLDDDAKSPAAYFDPLADLFSDISAQPRTLRDLQEAASDSQASPATAPEGAPAEPVSEAPEEPAPPQQTPATAIASETLTDSGDTPEPPEETDREETDFSDAFPVELEEQWEPLPEAVRQELSIAYEQAEEFGRGTVKPLDKEDTLAEGFIPPEEVSGAVLKKLRMNRGVSVGEMSELLQIPEKTLTAMEEEDFAQLADAGYLRWEIMTYARELSVDAKMFAEHYMRRYRAKTQKP